MCTPDTPYTAIVSGDCEDGDKNVNPGMDEDCENGADENCDGKVNDGCIYASCKAALNYNAAAESGAYSIDPDGQGPAFDVYCDMETDDGGWTLVMKQKSKSGYGSPLSVGKWTGWGTANQVMNESDASLDDENMVNMAYSKLSATQLRMTASQTWVNVAAGAWVRTISSTAYTALSNANGNQTGNEGGNYNTPWPAGPFTDHTWTTITKGDGLCWRTGPYFNRTSYQNTNGGIKWGYMFNNECGEHTTDTSEGLGCCGNSHWYRESDWALYLWVR